MTDRNGCVDDLAVIHRFEAVSYCFFFFIRILIDKSVFWVESVFSPADALILQCNLHVAP